MIRLLLLLLLASCCACSANQSILHDQSGANGQITPTEASTPPESSKRFTVAELMNRIAMAPPDAFLFPCTLNAYSDQDRVNLKKLRERWLNREKDGQYLIAPSTGCVCPGICVLAVENIQKPPPTNFSLIILDQGSPSSYYWLARDLDLRNAGLGWESTTPKITFSDSSGGVYRTCSFERGGPGESVSVKCVDPGGKQTSLEQ